MGVADQPGARRRRPAGEKPEASPGGSSGSSDGSWASTEGPNPLGLEGAPAFEPADERPPVAHAADLEADDEYRPPPPEPVEWTAERAGAVLRGSFFLARVLDPVARELEGKALELWVIPPEQAVEVGEPLARIMNRYAPVRTLAGFADEAELGLTMGPLLAEHLKRRGLAIKRIEDRLVASVPPGRFEGAQEQAAPSRETLLEPQSPFPPPPEPGAGTSA